MTHKYIFNCDGLFFTAICIWYISFFLISLSTPSKLRVSLYQLIESICLRTSNISSIAIENSLESSYFGTTVFADSVIFFIYLSLIADVTIIQIMWFRRITFCDILIFFVVGPLTLLSHIIICFFFIRCICACLKHMMFISVIIYDKNEVLLEVIPFEGLRLIPSFNYI